MIAGAFALQVLGCAACMSSADSELGRGAQAGAFLLLGVIGCLLGAVSAVILFWSKRARMLEASRAFDGKSRMRFPGEGLAR